MIASQDRSGYFGASDTSYVVGNWKTASFEKWWLAKLGIHRSNYTNVAMQAGTNYEHKILEALDLPDLEMDKQIIIGRLRVNLDGNTPSKIYEVKTFNANKEFKVTAGYRRQVNVEMYAYGVHNACIVAYPLTEKEYNNFLLPVNKKRIAYYEIEYDEKFINKEYLPKLKFLEYCLVKGIFPTEERFLNYAG